MATAGPTQGGGVVVITDDTNGNGVFFSRRYRCSPLGQGSIREEGKCVLCEYLLLERVRGALTSKVW